MNIKIQDNIENPQILISIIMPIYKAETYLIKSINSILNQTLKNFELILIDDGSPDNSGKMCDEFAKKDNRIKVIRKENGGASTARNAGLDIAKGQYIAFVDSDDWIEPNMYESLFNLAENSNADIAQCNYLKAEDENVKIINQENEIITYFDNIESLHNLYNDMYVSTVVLWNKIYKKFLFDKIRFPLIKIFEDEAIMYKLLFSSNKLIFTNKKLYYYRNTPDSIMNAKFDKKRLCVLDVFDEKVDFMSKLNNESLYAKTLKWYLWSIIDLYFGCIKNFPDDYETISLIKNKATKVYSQYIKSSKHEFKWIVLFSLFKTNPKIYKFVMNILK
ncbi:glycosyltransferase family 2 protein [Clostridium uliginosum]|uniref:Glycosyltransferase involved in cell wall bisynthesis n=1 Tax=Clostridium uliginosum TaxID=119641 RepID=A0A1I1ML44_9CLOT|nr:glycosyltransferase [Clostridium uliginosum]SFC85816.1 Glycosyltransferase involved in cell wall bisynthesis [Clostridium uliginosum]